MLVLDEVHQARSAGLVMSRPGGADGSRYQAASESMLPAIPRMFASAIWSSPENRRAPSTTTWDASAAVRNEYGTLSGLSLRLADIPVRTQACWS